LERQRLASAQDDQVTAPILPLSYFTPGLLALRLSTRGFELDTSGHEWRIHLWRLANCRHCLPSQAVRQRITRQGVGISGLNIGLAARTLVNDLEDYPHAFVLGCIADRRAHADIAWSIPGAIREAAGDFEFETLAELPESVWSSVLETSGHPLATKMKRLLPAAIRFIAHRYDGDAARIWATGSSGIAVARRFLAFDGVGPKIANMAANILIREFGIELARPMPDIAVDTHVLRVFVRLGLLRRLDHSQQRSTDEKQKLRVQLRARELSPDWPGELDWPTWHIGREWCHARRERECGECRMGTVCPSSRIT